MSHYRYDHDTPLLLDVWQFQHSRGESAPREVTVPHSAMRVIDDVRAGGHVTYRATLELQEITGLEALRFDSAGPDAVVTVNGEVRERRVGLWGVFTVALAPALRIGQNVIEVQVTLPDYEPDSPNHFRNMLLGFVPDVAGPFAGIWQPVHVVELSAVLDDVVIDLDHADRGVRVRWVPKADEVIAITVSPVDGDGPTWRVDVPASQGQAEIVCAGARAWSPSSPTRYLIEITNAEGALCASQVVGFRDLRRAGNQIFFGDEPFAMRGILHWGYDPDTGIPYMTEEQARAELELIAQLGFNTVKLCLFVGADHYYRIADELGLVIWEELPLWLPRDIAEVEPRVDAEYPRILAELRNHPSMIIVSLGCELDGTVPDELLARQYDAVRAAIPDAVIVANSGSEVFGGGAGAPSDVYDYHFYGDIQHLHGLFARFTHALRAPRPWIFGEFNDFDVWRTIAERPDGAEAEDWLSTDFAVNPLRSVHAGFASDQPIYSQREIIRAQGYDAELAGLEALSLQQGHAARKLVLEYTRSLPEVSGYVITVLRDAPITSAGVLDLHGQPKWSTQQLHQLHAPIMMSLSSAPGRRWIHGGDRMRVLDPYNLCSGSAHRFVVTLANNTAHEGEASLTVALSIDGETLLTQQRALQVASHRVADLGEIDLGEIPTVGTHTRAAQLTLALSIGGEISTNSWEVLVHPAPRDTADVTVLDPRGVLDDLSEAWGITPLRDAVDLRDRLPAGGLLISTQYDHDIRDAITERGARAFVLASGQVFPITRGPFWRENVKRVHDSWLRAAVPTEHLGTAGMALAGDRFIRRNDIRDILPEYRSLLSRYDARTFVAAEYVFEWDEGESTTTVSTLSLGAGIGPQPSFAGDNTLGRRILEEWMNR